MYIIPMTTVNHGEPNTTVARLHISLNSNYTSASTALRKSEVIKEIKTRVRTTQDMPSGATVYDGIGLWYPRTEYGNIKESQAEETDNVIVEMWVDNQDELKAVKDFKRELEDRHDHFCLCLSLEDKYFIHDEEEDQ